MGNDKKKSTFESAGKLLDRTLFDPVTIGRNRGQNILHGNLSTCHLLFNFISVLEEVQ